MRHSIAVPALVAVLAALPAGAQQIQGRVLDRGSQRPVADVVVTLIDDDGRPRRSVTTDSVGRFRLELAAPGRYTLHTRRLGYVAYASVPLDIARDQRVDMLLPLTAVAARLNTVTVEENAGTDPARRVFGLDARTMGGRVISRRQIERHLATAQDVGDLLKRQNIPGLDVSRYNAGQFCVSLGHDASCMDVYVDGAWVSNVGFVNLHAIERMVILRPAEAGVLFGTGASHRSGSANGVLLIYTRQRIRNGSDQKEP